MVVFERHLGTQYNIEGFLIGWSKNYFLIQRLEEFHIDGFILLRRSDVDRLRPIATVHMWNKILREEGVTATVSNPCFKLKLAGLPTILRDIRASKQIIIVDCDYSEKSYLYIGKPDKIGTSSVSFRWFGVDGIWQSKCVSIPYVDISSIRFESEYISVYEKYVRGRDKF